MAHCRPQVVKSSTEIGLKRSLSIRRRSCTLSPRRLAWKDLSDAKYGHGTSSWRGLAGIQGIQQRCMFCVFLISDYIDDRTCRQAPFLCSVHATEAFSKPLYSRANLHDMITVHPPITKMVAGEKTRSWTGSMTCTPSGSVIQSHSYGTYPYLSICTFSQKKTQTSLRYAYQNYPILNGVGGEYGVSLHLGVHSSWPNTHKGHVKHTKVTSSWESAR